MTPKRKLCGKCGKTRLIKQFTSPRGRVCKPCQKEARRSTARKKHLDETYDLSQEEYDELLAAQDGGCAICGGKRQYNLQVDHCHKIGILRGLLCKRCNKRLLPACKDSVEILKAAIEYLENPPAQQVIGARVAPIHHH